MFGVEGKVSASSRVGFTGLSLEPAERRTLFLAIRWATASFDGIQVPYHLNTPQDWRSVFREAGWSINEEPELGSDQLLLPEPFSVRACTEPSCILLLRS